MVSLNNLMSAELVNIVYYSRYKQLLTDGYYGSPCMYYELCMYYGLLPFHGLDTIDPWSCLKLKFLMFLYHILTFFWTIHYLFIIS